MFGNKIEWLKIKWLETMVGIDHGKIWQGLLLLFIMQYK